MGRVLGAASLVLLALSGCGGDDDSATLGYVVVSEDGRLILAFVGTCDDARLDVEEAPGEIRLTPHGRDVNGSGCDGEELTVRLDQPIGDRRIIDTESNDEANDVVLCGESRRPRFQDKCRALATG